MASCVNEGRSQYTYNLQKRDGLGETTATVTYEMHLLIRKKEHLGAEEMGGYGEGLSSSFRRVLLG